MIDYAVAAGTYDNTRRSDDTVIELMARRGVFARGARVLDFGCGTGNYLEKLSERYECELFGLEPAEGMRGKARAKNPRLRIEAGDHAHMPFCEGSFDFIFMTDVIHHVADLGGLFATLASSLRPKGRACVVTESWSQIDRRWYNSYFPSLAVNEKARYPDIVEIARRASEAGLGLERIEVKDNAGPHFVDGYFLRMAEEKNYSMFRMLAEEEFEAGLETLKKDLGKSFDSPGAGESFVWLEKGAAEC